VRNWLLTFLLLATTAGSAAAQPIGWSDWVNPTTWGRPPGSAQRDVIEPFREMSRDEQVETSRRGAGDFVFNLGARLLVGPRCRVRLGKTFYDPLLDEVTDADVYTETTCVARGGAGSAPLVLRTQIATVTIRAADSVISYAIANDDAGASLYDVADFIVALERVRGRGGRIDVAANDGSGRSWTILRPGFLILKKQPGDFTGPIPASPALLAAMLARLEGLGDAAQLPPGTLPPSTPVDVLRGQTQPARAGLDVCATTSLCDTATVDIVPGGDFQ
jgi:hypothetical protein